MKIDSHWTLFLDRDGVINTHLPADYVKTVADFTFTENALPALTRLSQLFGVVVIVTNQQGIGKGLMTEADLHLVHDHLLAQAANAGARLDAVYYCPKLHNEPSNQRKPKPDMAYRAKQQFPHINFHKSIMIGDSLTDMEFGKALGMTTFYIHHATAALPQVGLIDYTFGSLWEAARYLDRHNVPLYS